MRSKASSKAPSKAVQAVRHMKENMPFTRPIPYDQRKQIFLPEFRITLIRTPFLPPRYATFLVPLSFNKLDLKDYLKRVYNVDTLKVRSYVEQQKPTRVTRDGNGIGPMRRPQAQKRMTVELVEPFVWPAPPEDLRTGWSKDQYYELAKGQQAFQDSLGPDATMKEPKKERESLAEQARRIQNGEEAWQPTWKALGFNYNRPLWGGLNPSQQRQTSNEDGK